MMVSGRSICSIVLFIAMLFSIVGANKETAAQFCPICENVLNAVRSVAKNNSKLKLSEALSKYCAVESLDVDHTKFCYNIDTIKKDLSRILDLGATNDRICKKVLAVNKDFCQSKQSTSFTSSSDTSSVLTAPSTNVDATTDSTASSNTTAVPFKQKRGFIYI